ncbi:MAG: cell division protein FtsZ [Muribaculaceae bacterium]|nr:cell division protein FtsZ [Muribaculaceae bacterium]MDE6551428.1 cell division protein FtsZ [Muribaculaceae bacterium]
MEDYLKDISNQSEFIDDATSAIIKVIGVGGGGDNAVNYMYRQNIPNVNFVVCNTDEQALRMSPVPDQLILGWDVTHGRGAGNDPSTGRMCAESSTEDIRSLFDVNTEMVFITAGMGGGTGTGAAPVVAKIAKEENKLTIGIVTIPFMFEGKKKIMKAIEGAREMQKHVDALLVINNENLIEIYPDLNFFNAFEKADDTLANAARSISEIISEECYINVDFEDVKATLRNSRTAIIATAYGDGEHRITSAIRNALHSPLMKKHDVNTSQRLLLKFSCNRNSENPITAQEMTEIYAFTSQLPDSIDVKWGIADNPELGDKLKVTILASGFDLTLIEGQKSDDSNNGTRGKGNETVVIFGNDKASVEEKGKQQQQIDATIAEIYGADKLQGTLRDANRAKYAVLDPSQFDDHDAVALLERIPTFGRHPEILDELRRTSERREQRSAAPQRPSSPVSGATTPDPDRDNQNNNIINF